MYRSLINELTKIFKSKKVYILTVLIIFLSAAAAYILKRILAENPAAAEMTNALSYPAFFLGQIGALVFPFIIIIQNSNIISDDYKEGTLKQTLLCPVTRSELLASKMLAVLLTNVYFLLMTLTASYIFGAVFLDSDRGYLLQGINIAASAGFTANLRFYAIMLIPSTVLGLLTLLISLFCKNSGVSVSISISLHLIQLAMQSIVDKVRPYLITTYFSIGSAFLKTDFSKYMFSMLTVLGLYFIVILIVGFVNINKRDILY
ncbi:MAG: ABC transporter permease subunit [Bacillota bacterium]